MLIKKKLQVFIRVVYLITLGLFSSWLLGCGAPNSFQNSEGFGSSELAAPAIIGGQEVKPNEPPAQTSVIVYDPIRRAVCSGSLVGNNMVISAAHCIGQDPRKLQIIFSNNLPQATLEMSRPVVGLITHPRWQSNTQSPFNHGDLALIKFQGTTPINYRASNLLPSQSSLRNGTFTVLAGHGISNTIRRNDSGILRQTVTTIYNTQFSATEVQIEQRNGRGSCHGDSGGPAYVVINGVYYLWGISSRGYQDKLNPDTKDQCNVFSIYTNLVSYWKWIQDTVRSLSLKNQFIFPQFMTQNNFNHITYY